MKGKSTDVIILVFIDEVLQHSHIGRLILIVVIGLCQFLDFAFILFLLPDLFHFVLEEFTDSFFFLDIAAEGLIQGSAGRAVRSFHVQLDGTVFEHEGGIVFPSDLG